MHELLREALATITLERNSKFTRSFKAVEVLLAAYGEAGFAERVVTEVPSNIPWEVVADLLGIAMWSSQDNGASICSHGEQWLLQRSDLRKIQIALHLDVYPFKDVDRMKTVLSQVAAAFPVVAQRCTSLVRERTAAERSQE